MVVLSSHRRDHPSRSLEREWSRTDRHVDPAAGSRHGEFLVGVVAVDPSVAYQRAGTGERGVAGPLRRRSGRWSTARRAWLRYWRRVVRGGSWARGVSGRAGGRRGGRPGSGRGSSRRSARQWAGSGEEGRPGRGRHRGALDGLGRALRDERTRGGTRTVARSERSERRAAWVQRARCASPHPGPPKFTWTSYYFLSPRCSTCPGKAPP
jgi:hypothetical protein